MAQTDPPLESNAKKSERPSDPAERSKRGWRDTLLLRDWQILFGYASSFESPLPSLQNVGQNLVRNGVAEAVFSSEGEAWWVADGGTEGLLKVGKDSRPVEHCDVSITMQVDRRRAQIDFSKKPTGYAAEGLLQAATLRYQELYQFGSPVIPPRYIRAYVGQCRFVDEESTLLVYPQIKIFENGVILVYFRVFAPDTPQTLPRFLRRFVNAPMQGFRRVLVPPGVAYWSMLAKLPSESLNWYRRAKTAWQHYQHGKLVANATRNDKDANFSFQLVSLFASYEEAVIKASEATIMGASDEILSLARDELGLGAGVITNDDLFEELVAKRRKSGESFEEAVDRLGDDVVTLATEKAKSVGKAVADEAIKLLREREETFAGLALTVMAVASFVAGSNESGPPGVLGLAVVGAKRPNRIGDHWGGHHHIHLIRFRNQAPTASQNARVHGEAFASIIARTVLEDPSVAKKLLPVSSRLFDDVGAYLALNGTLWVQSRQSLALDEEFADPNKGHLLHEHQAKAEVLDYAYALHRRIAEAATAANASLEDVIASQRDLADFELAIHDASHFGEIRDLIEAGLEAYGIRAFRSRMVDAIRVREVLATQKRTLETGRYATVLSLVAGALAVPSLATAVIAPFWTWRAWPAPVGEEPRQLMFVGAAAVIVFLILAAGSRWAHHSPADRSSSSSRFLG